MLAWLLTYRPTRLRMMSRPIMQLSGDHHFIFRPRPTSFTEPMAFEWQALDAMIPSLDGTIAFHRFGPIVLMIVRADFHTSNDTPGRLLHDSVAHECALRSLRALCASLRYVISSAPAEARASTERPDPKRHQTKRRT